MIGGLLDAQYSLERLFGEESLLGVSGVTGDGFASAPIWQGAVFQLLLFGVLSIYLLWFTNWSMRSNYIVSLFNVVGVSSGAMDRPGVVSAKMRSFYRVTVMLGLIVSTIFAVKIISQSGVIGGGASLVINENNFPLLVFSVLLGITLFQHLLLMIVGYVTYYSEFTSRLINLRSTIYSFSVLVYSPVVFITALRDWQSSVWMVYLVAILAIFISLLFIYKSFLLFVSKKVSILHWILYLCAVEIFPFTFVWSFFTRN